MKLSRKEKLRARMRATARRASEMRLHGKIRSAAHYDEIIERLYADAKRARLGEGFLVRAEEEGRMHGRRAYDRFHGQRTSSPSGRDRKRRRRRTRRR